MRIYQRHFFPTGFFPFGHLGPQDPSLVYFLLFILSTFHRFKQLLYITHSHLHESQNFSFRTTISQPHPIYSNTSNLHHSTTLQQNKTFPSHGHFFHSARGRALELEGGSVAWQQQLQAPLQTSTNGRAVTMEKAT